MADHTLKRDTPATLIPAGTPVTLHAGSLVRVTQALGGSVTVRASGGLYRVDGEAARELGATGEAAPAGASGPFGESAVWEALRGCYDPEIPVNIVDLGLIYDLVVERLESGRHRVQVKMTLTAPGCGMGPVIANDARQNILALPEVEEATVAIVWEPQWTPQMISPEGRKALGLE